MSLGNFYISRAYKQTLASSSFKILVHPQTGSCSLENNSSDLLTSIHEFCWTLLFCINMQFLTNIVHYYNLLQSLIYDSFSVTMVHALWYVRAPESWPKIVHLSKMVWNIVTDIYSPSLNIFYYVWELYDNGIRSVLILCIQLQFSSCICGLCIGHVWTEIFILCCGKPFTPAGSESYTRTEARPLLQEEAGNRLTEKLTRQDANRSRKQ